MPFKTRLIVLAIVLISISHLWAVVFIRHHVWQSAEFLDYSLGCADTPQCARFGSNLFGQALAHVYQQVVLFYSSFYDEILPLPQLSETSPELGLSTENFTHVIYLGCLAVGLYLAFLKLLGTAVKSLAAVNGLLFVFSGFWLPLTIRLMSQLEIDSDHVLKLLSLFRMQSYGFLMHYDYLIVPAWLSTVFVIKAMDNHRITPKLLFGYAFLLSSIYESFIPAMIVAYSVAGLRLGRQGISFKTLKYRYFLALLAGQITTIVIGYGPQFGNADSFWIEDVAKSWGLRNLEYLPQLLVLFGIISAVSLGCGYLLRFLVRPIVAIEHRKILVRLLFSLLLIHLAGLGFAGYTIEAIRQTLGLQTLLFAAGISSGTRAKVKLVRS